MAHVGAARMAEHMCQGKVGSAPERSAPSPWKGHPGHRYAHRLMGRQTCEFTRARQSCWKRLWIFKVDRQQPSRTANA